MFDFPTPESPNNTILKLKSGCFGAYINNIIISFLLMQIHQFNS